MSKFAIYRHPFGISLNGREYALDGPDGDIMEFESREAALKWADSICPDVDVTDEEVLNEEVGLFICDLSEAHQFERIITLVGDNTSMEIVFRAEDDE
jgi:hypothetical protein